MTDEVFGDDNVRYRYSARHKVILEQWREGESYSPATIINPAMVPAMVCSLLQLLWRHDRPAYHGTIDSIQETVTRLHEQWDQTKESEPIQS